MVSVTLRRDQTEREPVHDAEEEAPGRGPPGPSGYRVLVRVRPPIAWDSGAPRRSAVEVLGPTRLRVLRPDLGPVEIQVDRALGPAAGQEEVFDAIQDVTSGIIEGKCGTVLAYGQTGSGKTHTMMGEVMTANSGSTGSPTRRQGQTDSQRGLIPRALERVFGQMASQCTGRDCIASSWHVYLSFMEIYSERVYDLLTGPRPLSGFGAGHSSRSRSGTPRRDSLQKITGGLDILEGRDGVVSVPGLTIVEVRTLDQAIEVLKIGNASRTSADNGVNPTSSRSHAIFQLILEKPVSWPPETGHSSQLVESAKLNFVDLAGSEKLQQSTAAVSSTILQELTSINLSLSTLGQCIAALVDTRRTHVPYRDSKLTRLLQDSLRGRSQTAMCVCISPTAGSLDETLSSLRFADRAKRAVLDPAPSAHQDAGGLGSRWQVEELMGRLDDLAEELRGERKARLRLEGLLQHAGCGTAARSGIGTQLGTGEAHRDAGDRGGSPPCESRERLALATPQPSAEPAGASRSGGPPEVTGTKEGMAAYAAGVTSCLRRLTQENHELRRRLEALEGQPLSPLLVAPMPLTPLEPLAPPMASTLQEGPGLWSAPAERQGSAGTIPTSQHTLEALQDAMAALGLPATELHRLMGEALGPALRASSPDMAEHEEPLELRSQQLHPQSPLPELLPSHSQLLTAAGSGPMLGEEATTAALRGAALRSRVRAPSVLEASLLAPPPTSRAAPVGREPAACGSEPRATSRSSGPGTVVQNSRQVGNGNAWAWGSRGQAERSSRDCHPYAASAMATECMQSSLGPMIATAEADGSPGRVASPLWTPPKGRGYGGHTDGNCRGDGLTFHLQAASRLQRDLASAMDPSRAEVGRPSSAHIHGGVPAKATLQRLQEAGLAREQALPPARTSRLWSPVGDTRGTPPVSGRNPAATAQASLGGARTGSVHASRTLMMGRQQRHAMSDPASAGGRSSSAGSSSGRTVSSAVESATGAGRAAAGLVQQRLSRNACGGAPLSDRVPTPVQKSPASSGVLCPGARLDQVAHGIGSEQQVSVTGTGPGPCKPVATSRAVSSAREIAARCWLEFENGLHESEPSGSLGPVLAT